MFEGARRGLALLRDNERLAVIVVSTVLVMSGQGVMSPVLPLFAKSFGVGVAAVGLTLSIFALARLILNVPLGILSDRYGRRLLLVGGPLVSGAGMLGSGLSTSLVELLAWRFVAGAGSAMYLTGAHAYLIDISSPSTRARVIATNQGALLLGVSVGPALGGLLAEAFGLRVPFLAVGAAALFTTGYAYLRLPETHHHTPAPTAAAEGGSEKQRPGWLAMLVSRDFACLALVSAAVFLTRAGGRMTLMPLLAAGSFGYSSGELGLLFAAMAIVNLAGLGPAATLADRLGRKAAIVPSGVIITAALLWMSQAEGEAGFLGSAVLLAIGTSIIGPAPAAFAADIAPPDERGMAMGLYRSAGDVGFLLGPFVLGALADATSISWALATNAALFLAATSLFALVARERAAMGESPG